MAIIGNPFADYVSKQISTRQKALGEGLSQTNPRQLKTLQAYNSKTPWIRLASAVSITPGDEELPGNSVYNQIEQSNLFDGFNWKNDSLSKNFVLYGGTNDNLGNNSPSGIINANPLTGAYGYGTSLSAASQGRGYVPPPGITNVEFEYKNDGALAFASVNVKAFSETQFQMIDILFQRPGYTCLLEFGHSVYLNNSGDLEYPDSYSTTPFEFLYNDQGLDVNYNQMAEKIQAEKEKWNGNYEGFFARITKYNWKFNPDGSYDITINLVGTGDVISSLKVTSPKVSNTPVTFKSNKKVKTPSEEEQEDAAQDNAFLISEAITTQLNYELYSIYISPNFPLDGDASTSDILLTDIPVGNKKYTQNFKNGVYKVDVRDFGGLFGDSYTTLTHIRFEVLLSILQKVCNLKDKVGNHLLNFDMVSNVTNKEKNFIDDTYIITYPGNFSANPRKCLIPYTSFNSNITRANLDTSYLINEKIGKDLIPITNIDQPELAMRLSKVYIDLNFITQTIKNLQGTDTENEDKVEVNLLDFLKAILEGVNTSLGGLNSFRVLFDENTHTIKIFSESPILNTKPNPNQNLTQLNTFGLTSREGSFVTEMNLNSELSDKFATQISVGAQTNGSNNVNNSTAFSTYNKGLVDRLMVEKSPSVEGKTREQEFGISITKEEPISSFFDADALKNFKQVYDQRRFGNDYISTLENLNSNVAKRIIGKYTQTSQSPVPFFLPFNLSLTMDGLGGMKIYEAFQVQGRGLPLSYNPSNMSLIIKSLSHSVSLDGWKTKIETLAKPIIEVTTKAVSPTPSIEPINPPSPLPPPGEEVDNDPGTFFPLSQLRENAMQQSFDTVFTTNGEVSGMCARWTYNLARGYVAFLTGNTPSPLENLPGGGNANNNTAYYQNLLKIGYTMSKSIVNKRTLRTYIEDPSKYWGYGDVVAYFCNDGPADESHVKYGHTQIYVGNINSSKWATSKKENYGAGFIYNSREGDNWSLYIFRAPPPYK